MKTSVSRGTTGGIQDRSPTAPMRPRSSPPLAKAASIAPLMEVARGGAEGWKGGAPDFDGAHGDAALRLQDAVDLEHFARHDHLPVGLEQVGPDRDVDEPR